MRATTRSLSTAREECPLAVLGF